MNERRSHLERYQVMSPRERNAELKGLFDLLPDFDATFGEYDPKDPNIVKHIQDIDDHITKRKNSTFSIGIVVRLSSLLSFAKITHSFRSYILDDFADKREIGVTKTEKEEFMGMVFDSDSASSNMLFQWDDYESGGIFDEEQSRDIEARAYNQAFRQQLMLKRIDETGIDIATLKEMVRSRVDIHDPEKLAALEEILDKDQRDGKKEKDRYIKGILKKEHRQKERVMQWRLEFIERYGNEP